MLNVVQRNRIAVIGPRRMRGVMALELVLTLPILLVLLLGIFEFSLLFFARNSVVQASRVAARQASLPGVEADDIRTLVESVLSPRLQQGWELYFQPGSQTGDLVTVGIRAPMASAAPDLLWPIGYSLEGRFLYAESTMIKE